LNKVVKMLLNLTVLGLLAGIILAVVYTIADPMIKENKARELRAAVFTVLPGSSDFVTLKKTKKTGEEFTLYVGLDDASSPTGVAFKADGNGYSGNVGVMVGLDMDYLKLRGIEVLDQLETPGLGDRIREPEFKDQFKGVEVRPTLGYIKYVKPEKPNQIRAITGATISSRSVVKNINNAVAVVDELFPKSGIEAEAIEALKNAPADAEPKGGDEDNGTEENDG